MKYFWLLLLLSFSPFDGLQRIALRNQYARQAATAYQKKRYQEAVALYKRVQEAEGDQSAVHLNLAHSYFHLREFSQASPLYRALLKTTSESGLQSLVANQLAVIEAEEGNFAKALAYSKRAIKADETNQEARFNYELLQKYLLLHPEKRRGLPPQKRPANRQRNPLQATTNGTPAPAGNGDNAVSGGSGSQPKGGSSAPQMGENGQKQANGTLAGSNKGVNNTGTSPHNAAGNSQGSNREGQPTDPFLQTRYQRLQKLNLTPEKARQLLDAMRQEEAQYLQQVPRRKGNRNKDASPDW